MKAFTLLVPVLLAASLATASLAQAQAFPPPPPMGERGPDRDDGPGPGRGPGMLPHGVKLSEAQQDKLFALHYAAEPARREREKAIRRAHDALRAMGESGKVDEAKAAMLAQTLGQSIAAQELDHVREQAQFMALLTPEQRAAMQQDRDNKPGKRGPGARP
ncbi:Spy/CpxP family protein refolding chaperone [Massilia sp. S19_KUP03_FR1]|uniref:Spy/CpxP family protein refolding chaperone n=1 Tax=Massilia sp. S19_KUP03_FR1 TaxID=3025503 RepID=UPI002FCD9F29